MMTKAVYFSELRRFLQGLGFVERRADKALVFRHPEEGRLFFRVYRDDEVVDARDLVMARKYLDLRGLMEANDFDAALRRPTSRA